MGFRFFLLTLNTVLPLPKQTHSGGLIRSIRWGFSQIPTMDSDTLVATSMLMVYLTSWISYRTWPGIWTPMVNALAGHILEPLSLMRSVPSGNSCLIMDSIVNSIRTTVLAGSIGELPFRLS